MFAAALILSAILYLAAAAFQRYVANTPSAVALGTIFLDVKQHNLYECVAAGLCIAAAFLLRRRRFAPMFRAERAIAAFAGHRVRACVFVGVLPLLIRAALLPVLGIPGPLIADEFGYLLLADTFASGRLINPTHPFWRHFETIYVFHQPGYTSIYPAAPALLLALAKALGMHPWIGVWVGAALMCGLICWMLQGWLPPKWAFLGGMIAVFRYTIVGSWMNTYWGGATAAIGGALVLGALPRILERRRRRDSIWFAVGLAILWQSRPFEGLLFALPPVGMLAYWLLKGERGGVRARLTHVVIPMALVIAICAAGTLWYDYRTTGNPFLPPYLLHQRIYGSPQTMFWQAPIRDAPGVHRYRDVGDVFRWQLAAHEAGFSWSNEGIRLGSFWQFYLQPLLTLPLLLLPLVVRNRSILVLSLSAVTVLGGNAMYPFFFPHYAAPLCGLVILLIVSGMRHLRRWRWRSHPVGAIALGLLLVSIAASNAATAAGGLLQPWHVSATYTPREQVLRELAESGGKHLVIVRYSPHHDFNYGVVFNDADIDHAPVVWAHDVDPASNRALAKYFGDRTAWFFNPDESPVTLVPFTDQPYISAVATGAGRRDDTRQGVSAGGIAILLGGNFARDVHGATGPGLLGKLPLRLERISAEEGTIFRPDPKPAEPAPDSKPPRMSVRFGAAEAPILAVSNMQGQEAIAVQVPLEVPAGQTEVTLRVADFTARKRVTVLPATPGIFQMQMDDGQVRGVVLHPDGSLVDLQHPAGRSEALRMFVTGLGPLAPALPANRPATAGLEAQPVYRLIVGVNHHGAPLVSLRYAEGAIGVEELTFRIPADVPAGRDIPLSIGVVVGSKTVYSNKSSLPVE